MVVAALLIWSKCLCDSLTKIYWMKSTDECKYKGTLLHVHKDKELFTLTVTVQLAEEDDWLQDWT